MKKILFFLCLWPAVLLAQETRCSDGRPPFELCDEDGCSLSCREASVEPTAPPAPDPEGPGVSAAAAPCSQARRGLLARPESCPRRDRFLFSALGPNRRRAIVAGGAGLFHRLPFFAADFVLSPAERLAVDGSFRGTITLASLFPITFGMSYDASLGIRGLLFQRRLTSRLAASLALRQSVETVGVVARRDSSSLGWAPVSGGIFSLGGKEAQLSLDLSTTSELLLGRPQRALRAGLSLEFSLPKSSAALYLRGELLSSPQLSQVFGEEGPLLFLSMGSFR